jgi:hypothetical protein
MRRYLVLHESGISSLFTCVFKHNGDALSGNHKYIYVSVSQVIYLQYVSKKKLHTTIIVFSYWHRAVW